MTRAKAVDWIADLFEEASGQITTETSRDQIAAWDSLGVLTLMAGLNREFEIVLSNEEIAALQSVDDILRVLQHNGKLSD